VSESFKEILDGIKIRNSEIDLITQVRKQSNKKFVFMENVDYLKYGLNDNNAGVYTS
jgi:hypothetical protein